MNFQNNAIKGVFLGFSLESNCNIVTDYKTFRTHLVREVVFDEWTPGKLTNNTLTKHFNNDKYLLHIKEVLIWIKINMPTMVFSLFKIFKKIMVSLNYHQNHIFLRK